MKFLITLKNQRQTEMQRKGPIVQIVDVPIPVGARSQNGVERAFEIAEREILAEYLMAVRCLEDKNVKFHIILAVERDDETGVY